MALTYAYLCMFESRPRQYSLHAPLQPYSCLKAFRLFWGRTDLRSSAGELGSVFLGSSSIPTLMCSSALFIQSTLEGSFITGGWGCLCLNHLCVFTTWMMVRQAWGGSYCLSDSTDFLRGFGEALLTKILWRDLFFPLLHSSVSLGFVLAR